MNTYVVGVHYSGLDGNPNGRVYNFYSDIPLKVSDVVVVETNGGGFAIAKVVTIEGDRSKATAWVVDRIDMDAYKEKKAVRASLRKLRTEMYARQKAIQDTEVFEILAAKDSKMAELLKAYKELQERSQPIIDFEKPDIF